MDSLRGDWVGLDWVSTDEFLKLGEACKGKVNPGGSSVSGELRRNRRASLDGQPRAAVPTCPFVLAKFLLTLLN